MVQYSDPNKDRGPHQFVVGSSEAPRVHGMNTTGKYDSAPRFKNQFFVHFKFAVPVVAGDRHALKGITYKVIQFDAPKFSIDTEILHQYNKRRIVPTKIQFDPCNITWHDTKDALIQDFWKFVYQFYFKDGQVGKKPENYSFTASTKLVQDPRHGGSIESPSKHYGYHLGNKSEIPNLFSYISLYLVANGKYTRIDLVNPYMVSFAHDTFSQDSHSEHATLNATFVPETVVYVTENQDIKGEQVLESYLGSDNQSGIFNHYTGWDSAREFNPLSSVPKGRRVIDVAAPGAVSHNKLGQLRNQPVIAKSDTNYINKWHSGDVERMEEILTETLETIANNPAPLASGGVNSSGFTDQVAVHNAELASTMMDMFAGAKETEQVKKVAKALIKAVAQPSVDTFDELGSATAEIADPGAAVPVAPEPRAGNLGTDSGVILSAGAQIDDSQEMLANDLHNTAPIDAPANISKGAPVSEVDTFTDLNNSVASISKGAAAPGEFAHAFANAISPAKYGVVVSGRAASLLGGTVPSFGTGTLSGITRGGLLGQGSALGQTLHTLGTIANTISIITGGNSFGKFSTGAMQVGSILQSLSTGNLRQAALTVGTTNHFSPNIEKAINVIDVVRSSQRLVGNNLNNSVVSSSLTASKPWVNPDTIGQKTVNTALATQSGKVAVDNFNSVFGPATSTQNKNIQPW
jgi:hypothetical protein